MRSRSSPAAAAGRASKAGRRSSAEFAGAAAAGVVVGVADAVAGADAVGAGAGAGVAAGVVVVRGLEGVPCEPDGLNGSWYWSSPAPCACTAGAATAAASDTRARSVTRRRRTVGTRPDASGGSGRYRPFRRGRAPAHPPAHGPRLDAPPGRRYRHEPARPGHPLDRVGAPRDGDRR